MSGTCALIDVDSRLLQRLNCPLEEIAKLCVQFQVSELSVFGSAVRDDYRQGISDIDFLVEFTPESHPTFHEYFDLSVALGELVGKKVDLVPRDGLKKFLHAEIFSQTQVIYARQ